MAVRVKCHINVYIHIITVTVIKLNEKILFMIKNSLIKYFITLIVVDVSMSYYQILNINNFDVS